MPTTREDISEWFKRAPENTTHMLVVCDTFDWEDYPVYVSPDQDIHERISYYSQNMQKIMEIYKMSMDLETQLNEHRARNI